VQQLPKKESNSFDVAAAIKELKESILDSRVNNIYQFDEKTILFKLHKIDKPPIRLVIEAGRRLHFTVYAEESPAEPPAFCMMLRQYLRGAWLVGIEQYEFERIVTISFRTKTGVLRLNVELFGDGNLILTNPDNVIIQALVFKRMRDRNILHGEVFQFPPSSGKNPFKITKDELQKALMDAGDVEVVRTLARLVGVGGVYSEEILLRAQIEKTVHCKDLTDADIAGIFGSLEGLLSNITGGHFEPCIVLGPDDAYLDVVPFKLKRYESFKTKAYSGFNEALDEFFLRVSTAEKAMASVEVDKLQQEAKRLKRVIADQEKALSEDVSKSERDKTIGNTIYAHFNELEGFVNKLLMANQQGKEWNSIIAQTLADKKAGKTPEAFIESVDSKNLAVNFGMDNLHFSLTLRKSLFDNANEYYERGKRAKEKAAGALSALDDSKKKLGKIERQLSAAEELRSLKPAEVMEALAKRKVERESKEWFEKFRWFNSSDGFLVVAGKDTVSNEVLVKKYTLQEDAVFHAEITGSPFVVVKAEGKPISEQVLREAGEYAASFSRAWRENAGSADVYWVKPDQLSKSGPSGESVPHGAFFVVGKRNWTRNTPLRIAVGAVVNEEACFIGGPVDMVKAKTKAYVVLVPGDLAGKELLKQVLKSIMLKLSKEQREKLGKTSIEQIREFIPYTKASITQKIV
jgi:predicted ribosome quality control (RQC) complex YloA/Tae2 family protein